MKSFKRISTFLLLVLTLALSLMITAYATSVTYTQVYIPSSGGHTDLTAWKDAPTTNRCSNKCTYVSLPDKEWDFWVDQDQNGQILPTKTISEGLRVTASYDEDLNSNAVKGRASTRRLSDNYLLVSGEIDFSY